MNSATGSMRHARQAWRLVCIVAVAAALAGCGMAQDVARQAGLPDGIFQALGFPDHHAAAAAPAPVVAVAPAPKHEARRSHHRRHHTKGHADKAAAKTADAAALGSADPVPPPVVANSDGVAEAAKDVAVAPPPEAAATDAPPHADEHAAAAPAPNVPSHATRKQVEGKVYAAIQHCKDLHRQGGLGTYQQTAECMGPRIWAAWHDANYPYMDLIGLYVSALERGAARLDRHEITEAEFEQEMTRLQARMASEEQRRNLPAAQLTNISGTAGLAPME
jgi:hypothetical protein